MLRAYRHVREDIHGKLSVYFGKEIWKHLTAVFAHVMTL